MAGSSIIESLFQRTLDDVIKGLRLQLVGESTFISKVMEEIRREIKSTDPDTKATALQKLTYLNSVHGLDMSWAAFHVVEVIGSSRFAHKKIGYLAASQSFHEGTDVILLITNQLRKDLTSTNEFEVSLALECLSRIATIDLSRDLTPEIFTLLSSSKSLVRKKATGAILKVFDKYPDAVRVCFKRLVENLESSDQQTVSATVGVFCELASKDPISYLPLAPEFYKILVDSKNNWVLIKVMKIFAKLAVLEPRLAKRVVEPVCEHMRRTGAKSLMFECIRTIVTSLAEYESAVKLAVVKIRELLVDDDPNLKYLGLQALSIVAPKHLWAVLDNKEVVIKSLSDEDPNIKLESLRLVMAMVSDSNVVEISKVLVNYALKSDPEFCNEILGSILSTCSRNVYEIIIDFDWYVSLLGEMSRIPHCQKGEEIENQFIDIGMRVKDVRPQLVRVGRDLLIDPALLGNPFLHQILSAAAWASGEYVEFSRNPFELMEALLQPRTSLLPPSIRAVYIHAAFKVLIFCLGSYLCSREIIASSSLPAHVLATGVSGSVSGREWLGSATFEGPANSSQDAEFNPRVAVKSSEDHNEDTTTANEKTSSYPSLEDGFTQDSINNLFNLIEMCLGPLSGGHEVELQERACNVLGFIGSIKKEISGNRVQGEESIERKQSKTSEIIKVLFDAFSKGLGPVSASAQERVPVPDGLTLKENLSELEMICGDVQLPSSNSFSFGSPHSNEKIGVGLFNLQSNEESEPSTGSTSLLAEHRRRHGLYYLPAEKNELVSTDYPPANDPKLRDDLNDDAKDLVKLTEQSLVPKKKPNHAKPRPVVVKLDEGDEIPNASKNPERKDNLLSGAVRDVLFGNEAIPTSSQKNPSDKSSSRRKGKEKADIDLPSKSKENLGDAEKSDLRKPGSRTSKHRSHGKERRQRSPEKNCEVKEDNVQNEKHKSSHRHGKHKARHRADGPLNVVAQASVIPDFLL